MVTFSNFCSVALVFSLQATSLHAAKSSTPSRGLASIDGDQRCIANNPSKYEVFNHGAWIEMPLAGGTKCCPHVDDSTKIIMQNVGMECPAITNDGGGPSATPSVSPSSLPSAGPSASPSTKPSSSPHRSPKSFKSNKSPIKSPKNPPTNKNSFKNPNARRKARSTNLSEPADRRKLATASNGDQRCVPNNDSQYQVYDHVMWVTMPMPPGTKCCDDLDDARIIIQHAGESCVINGGGGGRSTKSPKARRV